MQPIMPVEWYVEIEKKAGPSMTDESFDSKMVEFDNIHHKVIFDTFNSVLEDYRVYGKQGTPMPWNGTPHAVSQTHKSLRVILREVKKKVL